MQTLDKLIALRTLFSDRSRWTQHQLARDALGNRINPASIYAECFCMIGAACKVENSIVMDIYRTPTYTAILKAGKSLSPGHFNVPDVNDGLTHLKTGETGYPAVMKIIDRAIEMETK